MNLKKFFNKNYLIQNIKKSKVMLVSFIGLVPILNTIILIMILNNNHPHILNFEEISILNLIGMYFLPIIISISLFNYIYKKKSVDFINSMPISRKSIFVTNLCLGIIVLTLMLFINTILLWLVCLIFHSPIPFAMIFDYFIFFFLTYIFIFSATNLAMTISGNAITQIVITLLILFLVPYSHFYTNILYNETVFSRTFIECPEGICNIENYDCHELDTDCSNNLKLNRYKTDAFYVFNSKYTTPFDVFKNIFYNESNIINKNSIIKMIILSIVYMFLACYLFIKRKMEITETSFRNIHIHNLVKSLTLVPIVAISYSIARYQEQIVTIFLIILMFVYYIVYDFITKKNVQNIKMSVLYFLVTVIILGTTFSLIDQENSDIGFAYNETIIKYDEIKEVSLYINPYIGRNYNSKCYLSNKELINFVVNSMIKGYEYNENMKEIKTYIKTTNDKEYSVTLTLNEENYDQLIQLLSNEPKYLDYYKNMNTDKIYALKLGNKIYTGAKLEEYLIQIKNILKNLSLQEYLELQEKYGDVSNYYYITLYTYKNHNKEEITINSYIDYDLLNIVVNLNNASLAEIIPNTIPKEDYQYKINYKNSYLNDSYIPDYYVALKSEKELYEFMLKNISDEIDMRKEYFTFIVYLYDNKYYFTTNKVDEVIEILNKKYEEIKDTEDYLNYYNYSDKESVEYYD